MMRHDLATQTAPQCRDTQVVIIGAGIAGLVLAKQLADLGIPCVLLESGGLEEVENDLLYTDVDFRRRPYGGATKGRSRCLGGTSVKWGGALLPFRETDFKPRRNPRLPDWPIRSSDLAPHVKTAEYLFGLDHSTYDAVLTDLLVTLPTFVAREAKWPSFKNRNVTVLFGDIAEGRGATEVWLNATVRRFDIKEGTVREVTAFGSHGQTLTVKAQQVVLCAGAIETTRLMLLLDQNTKGKVVAGRKHLGRYFQDHLSLPLARIETTNPTRLNEFFGFRFTGRVMRSLRFEQGTAGEVAGFVHVAPRTLGPTGFDALRDFMRSLQRRKPDLWALLKTLRHSSYLARLVWWRFVKKRLLWPGPAEYDVHFVIEQLAYPENRIVLGAREDQLGHPVAEIDWDISEEDAQELDRFRKAFEQFWSESGLEGQGRLIWTADAQEATINGVRAMEGIYHPVGTTRMAEGPDDGVVDRDLRVFGLSNLYLGATSVFPNGGSANPTMTLILLILRLAKHLEAQCIPPSGLNATTVTSM